MSLIRKPAWRCLVRSLVILITLTFVLPYLTWAFDQGTFNAQANAVFFNQQPVKIPSNLGLVTKKFQGNDRLVVYIQDLHCNLEVQKNIAGVINYLVKQHQLGLVGVEGAEGAIDVSKLASFPVRSVREKVGRYFIKEGKMSGPEYYTAVHNPKLGLEGIETLADYEANRTCVKRFLNDESQGLAYDLKEELDGLKETLYDPALKAHDRNHSQFTEGQKSLLDYAVALAKALVDHKRDLAAYPALKAYVSQRTNVFPANVDSDQLYQELELAEADVRQKLYRKDAERMLDEMLRRLRTVEHLLNIAATPAELDEYRQHPERFRVEAFMDFIQSFNPEFAEIGADCFKLNQYLKLAQEFYRVADLRSQRFVDNTLNLMGQRGTRIAVMITGGYHSDQIQALLQQRGISFLAVKPRLTKVDLVNPYFSLLRERKTPLEKLLAQNQNILALPTNYPSAALRNSLPEAVTTFLNQADIILKDAALANQAADGKLTLAQLKAAFLAQVAAYPENNAKIEIDWEQARANEARGVYLLPFKNLAITALIRPATGQNQPDVLASLSIDDFEIALIDNQTAKAKQDAYLNQGRRFSDVARGFFQKVATPVQGWAAALSAQAAGIAQTLAARWNAMFTPKQAAQAGQALPASASGITKGIQELFFQANLTPEERSQKLASLKRAANAVKNMSPSDLRKIQDLLAQAMIQGKGEPSTLTDVEAVYDAVMFDAANARHLASIMLDDMEKPGLAEVRAILGVILAGNWRSESGEDFRDLMTMLIGDYEGTSDPLQMQRISGALAQLCRHAALAQSQDMATLTAFVVRQLPKTARAMEAPGADQEFLNREYTHLVVMLENAAANRHAPAAIAAMLQLSKAGLKPALTAHLKERLGYTLREHPNELEPFVVSGEPMVVDTLLQLLEPKMNAIYRAALQEALENGASAEIVMSALRQAGGALAPRTGYLLIQRQAGNEQTLRTLIESAGQLSKDSDRDMAYRIYAFNLYAARHIKAGDEERFWELANALAGEHDALHRYLQNLLADKGRVTQLFMDPVYNSEELKVYTAAIWADTVRQHPELPLQGVGRIARVISGAGVVTYGENAYASFKVGLQLIREAENSRPAFLTLVLAHELMHNILFKTFDYPADTHAKGTVHEFLADTLAKDFAQRYGLPTAEFERILRYQESYESAAEHRYSNLEVHAGARALLRLMEKWLQRQNQNLQFPALLAAAIPVLGDKANHDLLLRPLLKQIMQNYAAAVSPTESASMKVPGFGFNRLLDFIFSDISEAVEAGPAGELIGALLGEQAQGKVAEVMYDVLKGLSYQLQPDQTVMMAALELEQRAGTVMPAFRERMRVESVALETAGERAGPVRKKLGEYLAQLPENLRSQLNTLDSNTPVEILKGRSNLQADADLDRIGVFHFNGKIYIADAVFRKLADEQRDDAMAAILLHEILEAAGLSHEDAVRAVEAATEGKFPQADLVQLAGLALDQDLENLKQKDYYSRLGLTRNATPEELKTAFRRVAFKTHPDMHKGNPYAEDNFRRLDEAYAVLSDQDKRQAYDQWQANPNGLDFQHYVVRAYTDWAHGSQEQARAGFDWESWATATWTAPKTASQAEQAARNRQHSGEQVWVEFIGAHPGRLYDRLNQVWAEDQRRREAGTPVEQERKAAAYRAAWSDVPDAVWQEAHGNGPYSPFITLKYWRLARMREIEDHLQTAGRMTAADAARILNLELPRAEKLLGVLVNEGKLTETRAGKLVAFALAGKAGVKEPGATVNGQFVTFRAMADLIAANDATGLVQFMELGPAQREEVKSRLTAEGQRRLMTALFLEQSFAENAADHDAAAVAELEKTVAGLRQQAAIPVRDVAQESDGLRGLIQGMLEQAGQERAERFLVRDEQDRAIVSSLVDLAVTENLISRGQADSLLGRTQTYEAFVAAENRRQLAGQVTALFHQTFPAETAMPQAVAEAFADGIENGSLTLNHLAEKFKFDRHAQAELRPYTVAEAREFSFKGALYPAMDTSDLRLVQTDAVLGGLVKYLRGLNAHTKIGVVDLGFGLVPLTTHRTAATLNGLDRNTSMLGIELQMPHTLVTDTVTQVQAAFDQKGNVLFLAADGKRNLSKGTEEAILRDWPALSQRLRAQREALLQRAGAGEAFYKDEAGTVNPWQDPQYQAEQMRVQQGDLTQLALEEKADLIRAANLDLHFTQEEWKQAQQRIADNLREGGFLLEARTHMLGWGMIYKLYQKQGNRLVQLDAKQVARLGIRDQDKPAVQVSSRALSYVDSLQTRMLKVVRELMDYYGPELRNLQLLDELGQGDFRDLQGGELVRLGISMQAMPDQALLDRWKNQYGIELRQVAPNIPGAVKIDVRAFGRQSGTIMWGMMSKLTSQLAREGKSNMVLAAPDRGRAAEGPSLSIRNAFLTGLLFTGVSAVLTGNFVVPILAALVYGAQVGLMLAIRIRYNRAHPGEEKPLIDWLLREQVSNIRQHGIMPEYLGNAGQFTRTWFRWHENVERILPFRYIPVVGNSLNHLVAALTDPMTGMAATLKWAWNVIHLCTTPGSNVGLNVANDYNGMSQQAADYIAERINQLIAEKGRAVISLAAGSTPETVYRLLAANAEQYAIDWSKVHFFHTEEYIGVDQDKAPSRKYLFTEQVIKPLGVPEANFHFLNGRAINLENEAKRYEREITALGGIDIQLLGIGRNGHIGGNEPGVSSFGSRTGNVRWMEESRKADARFFDGNLNAVPKRALAMGLGTILEAREVVMLASGSEKAVAVAKALQGPITWRLPASALRLHPMVNFFTDEAAAKGLSPTLQRGLKQGNIGRLGQIARLSDLRAWQKEQADVFRSPLTLTTGLIVISLLLFGAYPLLLAGALLMTVFFLPRNGEARKIFLQNLKHEFAWPSRFTSGTIVFFGLALALTGGLMLAGGMIGVAFAAIMVTVGLTYLGWGAFNFLRQKAIITLDGPDLEGKQDIAMALSENYGYTYVDASLIYRSLAAKALMLGLDLAAPNAVEMLAKTKLQFVLDRHLGRQRVFMDGKEITKEILGNEGVLGLNKVMETAKVLGKMQSVEDQVKERILRMSTSQNLVVVGQNMGNLLDRNAKVKFYITGDLKARAEQLLKKRLAEEPTLDELAKALKTIRKKEMENRRSQIAPAKPQSDAIVIDSTRISPGDAIARAMGVVEERASALFPIRAWWNRTYRPTHRMFERAEGEIVKRQLFENRGDLWIAKSDIDNLSALNQFYGKKIVNFILDDINQLRLEGINLPAVRRMTKGAISIRDGGDEATTVLDGKLLPGQVKLAVESMRKHVQENLRSRYRILTLAGFEDNAKHRAALDEIAETVNKADDKMLRVTHDPIYGTQLLLRVDYADVTPEQQVAELTSKIAAAGLGELKPLDLSAAVREVMGEEAFAKMKPSDRDMLARGALWPCPTISIGATKSSRSLPAERAAEIQEKFAKKELTRAELAEWMDATDKLAADFLHEAKQKLGKNSGVVDPLVGELEIKEAETGTSSLDPRLKQRIDLERTIYEYNGLLKDERGKQLYDGLVPWALSSAGLRQYVMEALEALKGKSVFEPQVFIARAPPSVGPDKIQLVLVTPEQTTMIELEGRYWGGRFEDLAFETLKQQMTDENAKLPEERRLNPAQLKEAIQNKFASYQVAHEDGRVLYKFSTLNNLINYTTGDEMILAPQYFTNDLSLQARFLEKIRGGGLDDTFRLFVSATQHNRNLDAAVKGLIKSLEGSLNDEHDNLVKISPAAIWSSIPTADAMKNGLGRLFQETTIAGLARKERFEPYSQRMLGDAQKETTRRSAERLAKMLKESAAIPGAEPAASPLAVTKRGTPAFQGQAWRNQVGQAARQVATGMALGLAIRLGLMFTRARVFERLLGTIGIQVRPLSAATLAPALTAAVDAIFDDAQKRALLGGYTPQQVKQMLRAMEAAPGFAKALTPAQRRLEALVHGGLMFPVMEGRQPKYLLASPNRLAMIREQYPNAFGEALQYVLMHELVCLRDGHEAAIRQVDALAWPSGFRHADLARLAMNARELPSAAAVPAAAPAMSVRNAVIAGAAWGLALGAAGLWQAAAAAALMFGFQVFLMLNLWRNYQADQPEGERESLWSWLRRTGGSVAAAERGVFQEYHPYAGLLALRWFQMHESVERYLPFRSLPVLNHLLASLLDVFSGLAAAVLWGRNLATGRALLNFSRGVMPESQARELLRSIETVFDSQRMSLDDLKTPEEIRQGWSDAMDAKARTAAAQIQKLLARVNKDLANVPAAQRREFLNQLVLALMYRFDPDYTFVHSWRVGYITAQMARIYGLVHNEPAKSSADIQRFRNLGLTHDFGKILLPKLLLYKGQQLSDKDMALIRSHARLSGILLEAFGFNDEAAVAASHHEFLDGKGYPNALAEGQILDEAKALTVADSYDAAISSRPYRSPREKRNVLNELWEDATSAAPRYDKRWVAALWFAQRLKGTSSGPSTPNLRGRIEKAFAEKDYRNRSLRGERGFAERALSHMLKGVLFDGDVIQAGNAGLRMPLSGSVSFLRTAFLAVAGAFLLWLTGAKTAAPAADETLGVLVQIQSDATAEMYVRFGAGNFLHPGSVRPLSELGFGQRLLHPLGKAQTGEDGLPVFYMPDRLLQGQPEYRLPLLKMLLEYRLQKFESQNRQDLLAMTLAQPGFFQRALQEARMAVNPAGLLAGILAQDRSPVAQALRDKNSRAAAAYADWAQARNPRTAQALAEALLDAAAKGPSGSLQGSLETLAELSRKLPGFEGVVLGAWDMSTGARAGSAVVLPLALWRNPAKLERWLGKIRNLPVTDRQPLLRHERNLHGMRQDA